MEGPWIYHIHKIPQKKYLIKNKMVNVILLLIIIYAFYSLFFKKEGFGIKRRIQKNIKGGGLAVLRPVKRKILVPIDKKFNELSGTVSYKPPPDIPDNKPPKDKSVWLHPAVITGGVIGTATGIAGGEFYNRLKDGRFTKFYTIYNPFTKKQEFYRIGRSQTIADDDRLFVKYDKPPNCDRETRECTFYVKESDFK